MWSQYGAEIWTYDPSVDPPCMEKYDQFGRWVFVYRNPHKDRINTVWRQLNKERIVSDPGGTFMIRIQTTGKTFETIYCVGTGDVFYIGEGLGTLIQHQLRWISRLQSDRDKLVNLSSPILASQLKVESASASLYSKVCFLLLMFHKAQGGQRCRCRKGVQSLSRYRIRAPGAGDRS